MSTSQLDPRAQPGRDAAALGAWPERRWPCPNAVASIAGTVAGVTNQTFGYDANENALNGLGTTNTWTSFNQPASIDKLSGASAVQRTAWLYDTSHQRTRQTLAPVSGGVPGAVTNTIYYAGAIEKEIDTPGNLTTIRTGVAPFPRTAKGLILK